MFPAGPEQQAQDQSDPRRTSTASARSQRSPPDPNSKFRIRVFPAGPQLDRSFPHWPPDPNSKHGPQLQALDRSVSSPDPNSKLRIRVIPARPQLQALDRSVPRRTRAASSGAERSPPDLNHKESPTIYQIECQKVCQKICQIHMPERISDRMSE